MAKIKFGMMMTDARGKLGGQVFSKNRSGAYIRTKVTPVNPQSRAQAFVRSNLGTLSSMWSDLTTDAIAGFNSAVDDWQTTDIFGDLKKPTGKNLFVKLNLNLLNNGLPTISAVPAKTEMPNLGSVEVTKNPGVDPILLANLADLQTGAYQIEATPVLPNGVSFVKNRFRVIGAVDNPGSNPVDITALYEDRFGSIADTDNVHFRIRYIAPTGQASPPIAVKLNN